MIDFQKFTNRIYDLLLKSDALKKETYADIYYNDVPISQLILRVMLDENYIIPQQSGYDEYLIEEANMISIISLNVDQSFKVIMRVIDYFTNIKDHEPTLEHIIIQIRKFCKEVHNECKKK